MRVEITVTVGKGIYLYPTHFQQPQIPNQVALNCPAGREEERKKGGWSVYRYWCQRRNSASLLRVSLLKELARIFQSNLPFGDHKRLRVVPVCLHAVGKRCKNYHKQTGTVCHGALRN